eukprot:gene6434-8854_t
MNSSEDSVEKIISPKTQSTPIHQDQNRPNQSVSSSQKEQLANSESKLEEFTSTKAAFSSAEKTNVKNPQNGTEEKVKRKRLSLSKEALTTPSQAQKSGKSKSDTKETKVSTTKKKTANSATKKVKIEDVQESINQLEKSLVNLRKAKTRQQKAVESSVKYPVPDEYIMDFDEKGKAMLPLPNPVLYVDQLPADIVQSAIACWEFINVFSKQLSLHTITFKDFLDLMCYNSRTSAAIIELYSSLLRLILSDTKSRNRINASIPRQVNITFRSPTVLFNELLEKRKKSREELQSLNEIERFQRVVSKDLSVDEFDVEFNGLKFMPRSIRPDMIDSVKWQCILRAVLLRLQPVNCLRDCTADYYMALKHANTFGELPSNNNNMKNNNNSVMISKALMTKINTAKNIKSLKDKSTLDKDAIFHITSDVFQPLASVMDAASELDSMELHELSPSSKIIVLKMLCDACYFTERIQKLLEQNAEERAQQITNFNKQLRESKSKMKEVSAAKREEAIEKCRKINKALADKKSKSKSGGKGDKSKGNKGSNDSKNNNYDPTSAQIASMLEEMIFLESIGVDAIIDDVPLEAISDDEDDNEEEELTFQNELNNNRKRSRGGSSPPPMIKKSSSRTKLNELKKIRQEKRYRNQQIEIANEKLSYCLETKNERDIRQALKMAEKAELKFENDDGEIVCTEKMKQVYKLQQELDAKSKEDRAISQHEKALQEYFVRTSPIGSDRDHSLYWTFQGDDRLFVQKRIKDNSVSSSSMRPVNVCPYSEKSNNSNSEDLSSQSLLRIYDSRPSRYRYQWGIYNSATELWHLWNALDDRGERESELKAAIRARFDFQEPPITYLVTGSEYIGRKVRRTFTQPKSVVIGAVTGWLEKTDEDLELYHVVHNEDGDEEDLELQELLECLIPLDEVAPPVPAAPAAPTSGRQEPKVVQMTTDDDDEEAEWNETQNIENENNTSNSSLPVVSNEPKIIKSSIARYGGYNKQHPLGIAGLRNELQRICLEMNEGLKSNGGGFTREARKIWDNNVRLAETVDDFKPCIQELETLVRSLQNVDDKTDEEELTKQQMNERKEMEDEGWIFEKSENVAVDNNDNKDELDYLLSLIGRRARRFFKSYGMSDGVITCFLPANKNEGIALFQMIHSDGDCEDLEINDVLKGIHYYDNNIIVEEENDEEEEEYESDDDQ